MIDSTLTKCAHHLKCHIFGVIVILRFEMLITVDKPSYFKHNTKCRRMCDDEYGKIFRNFLRKMEIREANIVIFSDYDIIYVLEIIYSGGICIYIYIA